MSIKCLICGENLDNWSKLSWHLRLNHDGLSAKTYFDQYIKQDSDGSCVICSKPTKFKGIAHGYRKTCGKSCGCTLHRDNLRNNPEKFKHFSDKVSKNMEDIWEDREESGEKEKILAKTSKTLSENNSLLTEDERKEKFGWLNKLSEEDKQDWKEEVMFQTGAHAFWQNATQEEKEIVWKNRRDINCANNRFMEFSCNHFNLNEKEKYYKEVWRLTEMNWRRYHNIINPDKLNRTFNEYHLDHMYSISQGYINKVSEEIIASVSNLQMLWGIENIRKSGNCVHSLEELMEKYNETQSSRD